MQISKEEAIELCKELLNDSDDYASQYFNNGILKCVAAIEKMTEEQPEKEKRNAKGS